MLEKIIASKTKRKLLTLLLTNPKRKYYVREISRNIKANINSVRQELKKLTSIGLVSSTKEANLLYYQINETCSIYKDLKNLIYKTEALGVYLKQMADIFDDIPIAFIYGSTAYDKEMESSDIDLFVVADIDGEQLHSCVLKIEQRIGREINTVHMNIEEFKNKYKKKNDFLKRVLGGEKIFIKGDENAISRIIKNGKN